MAKNFELHQTNLSKINKTLIKKAIFAAYKDGITAVAPLGQSGDNVCLYGRYNVQSIQSNKNIMRFSIVELRNYNGDIEMLITDQVGNFIVLVRFDINMDVDWIANMLWSVFCEVADKIDTIMPQVSDFKGLELVNEFNYMNGYKLLKQFQKTEHKKNQSWVRQSLTKKR